MPWWRISRRSEQPSRRSLRPKTLRRTGNWRAAAGGDLHHRESALIAAVGAEPEQAIDAGKSRGVGERFRRKTLAALLLRQGGHQRHRVIGQRRGTNRVGAIFGAVASGESTEAGWIGCGIEPA